METIVAPINTQIGLKTIIIKPGETVVLPAGATVQSVVNDGNIVVSSTCDLPTPTTYKCGYFYSRIDNDNNSTHPLDETRTQYTSIKIGGVNYPLGPTFISGATIEVLNTFFVNNPIFKFMSIKIIPGSVSIKHHDIYLFFKVPEGLFDTTELKISNDGMVAYFKPIEATCLDYDTVIHID